MSIVEKIPGMTIEEINTLRKNATRKLDDPKAYQRAYEILGAIDVELERRYIPGMIQTFLESYPNGFYGDKQAKEEREYKVNASLQFNEMLGEDVFAELLQTEDYDELVERLKKAVGLTNFIQGSFEKPKLIDAIKASPKKFSMTLFELLYGTGAFHTRFDTFVNFLDELSLRKWTYATYFLFLSNPDKNFFVKPEMLKKALEISRYPLVYEAAPDSELYAGILEFVGWLKEKISELKPRDMIDVHSFVWHMAPTGKWSED